MDDITTIEMIFNYGPLVILFFLLVTLVVKYGSRFIDMLLKRAEEKNIVVESMKSVIDNNTSAFKLLEKALERNSQIIDNWTKNSHKLEQNIDTLNTKFTEHDSQAQKIYRDTQVLREKK